MVILDFLCRIWKVLQVEKMDIFSRVPFMLQKEQRLSHCWIIFDTWVFASIFLTRRITAKLLQTTAIHLVFGWIKVLHLHPQHFLLLLSSCFPVAVWQKREWKCISNERFFSFSYLLFLARFCRSCSHFVYVAELVSPGLIISFIVWCSFKRRLSCWYNNPDA